MNGIININKSINMTSHDVVNIIRRKLKIKKVGHTGTLDPIAEGVLPICIGNATKISQFIIEKDKEYIAEAVLGIKTDTFDRTGKVLKTNNSIPKENEISNALNQYVGDVLQTPPIYSAIKVSGKKLYEYARENIQVDIKPREVKIYDIELLEYSYPKLKIKVACSKGTYIRSLCNDIGEVLGSFAHMNSLVRTKSGSFTIENTVNLNKFEDMNALEIQNIMYPIDYPLDHFKKVDIKESSTKYLLNGNILFQKNITQNLDLFHENEIVKLYSQNNFKGLGKILCEDYQKIKPLRIIK
ncbi:MAG: tRNA pseudouridine(55) synthase TruB [Eubacteriaceae bacterium]